MKEVSIELPDWVTKEQLDAFLKRMKVRFTREEVKNILTQIEKYIPTKVRDIESVSFSLSKLRWLIETIKHDNGLEEEVSE